MKLDKIKIYMEMAHKMAELSPDAETKVGAIMLSSDNRIIASSYNGFLRGANDDKLPTTRPDKYEYIVHAERNMLYNCCNEGIRTKNTTIICTLSPCKECVRALYQSGVREIIFDKLYEKQFKSEQTYKEIKDVHISITSIGEYIRLQMDSVKNYAGIYRVYNENT